MRNTHHLFRATSLAVGLVLLLVTGTAAMMATFSGPAPGNRVYGSYVQPVPLPPLSASAQMVSPAGDDHLLYQRVARADGTQAWELSPALPTALDQNGSGSEVAATGSDLNAPGFSRVSYTLQAKPAGFSRNLKNCNSEPAGQTSKPKARPAYDISCTTVG